MPSSGADDWSHWAGEGLADHEAQRPPEGPPVLSRYEIRGRLGEGNTAIVYRAWDRQLQREVALKVLREGALLSEVGRERFRREAQATAGLVHPNVVAVHDAGEEGGKLYTVMELVEGRHLGEVLRDAGLPEGERIRLVEQAARGVAVAHRKGIVHRDLKPANILVPTTGEPKVGDFGLAHLMDATRELTRTGATLGTPLYMSPEQAEGRSREICPATDVYALGAILYEAATGQPPHSGETVMELYGRIVREEPVPPRRLNPKLSRNLETVILKALRKEAPRRYADAGAFADDLQRAREGGPVDARPDPWGYRIVRRLRRHALVVVLASAVGLAAVAAVALALRGIRLRETAVDTMREAARVSLEAALHLRGKGARRDELRPYLETLQSSYNRAIEQAPDVAELDYLMGRMQRALMKDDKALDYQEAALRKDPDYAPSLYERVILLSRKYGLKVQELTEVLPKYGMEFSKEADPPRFPFEELTRVARDQAEQDHPEFKRARESVLADLSKLLQRGEWLTASGQVRPAKVLAARGIRAFHQGDLDEARKILDECVAQDPKLEEAWETLAAAIEAGCRKAKSAEEVASILRDVEGCSTRAILHDEGYVPHWIRRANSRFHGADPAPAFEAAERDLQEALRLDPESAEAWHARGILFTNRGGSGMRGRLQQVDSDLAEGEKCFAESLRLRPESAEGWLWRGAAWRYRGQRMLLSDLDPLPPLLEAERHTLEALRLNPRYWTGWRNMGRIRVARAAFRRTRGEDSREELRAADEDLARAIGFLETADLWMSRGEGRLHLAGMADKRGELRSALEAYRAAEEAYLRAAKLDPKLASTVDSLLRAPRKRIETLTPR